MVWLKDLYKKIMNKLRRQKDPEELLEERIKKMKEKDPFIYK
jgi:hypothetical protein